MDERLARALDFSNYQITIETHRKNLESRIKKIRTVYYGNGVFTADLTHISNLNTLVSLGKESDVIIEDTNNNPIMVDSVSALSLKLIEAYNQSLNELIVGSTKINKMRSVKSLMGD